GSADAISAPRGAAAPYGSGRPVFITTRFKPEGRRLDMPEAKDHGQAFQAQAFQAQAFQAQAFQAQAFQADVAKLLHLMVHSVYSGRDVFLRELLSNAADACEKLRYEALNDPGLAPDSFAIKISLDKTAQSLAIEDNGIGMSRQDLTDHLG